MKLQFLAALLLASTTLVSAASAAGLHGFANEAHYLPRGGQQVTQTELGSNPAAYFAPGAYTLLLDYFKLTDAQFKRIVQKDSVVMECNGAEVASYAFNDQGKLVPTHRPCVAGERILVQKSTGRVLLLLGCLNPVIGWVIEMPKAVPFVTKSGGSGDTHHVTPPPTCEGSDCNPPPPPPCDDCNPPPDDGCGDGNHHGGGDGGQDNGGGDDSHHGGGDQGDGGDDHGHGDQGGGDHEHHDQGGGGDDHGDGNDPSGDQDHGHDGGDHSSEGGHDGESNGQGHGGEHEGGGEGHDHGHDDGNKGGKNK